MRAGSGGGSASVSPGWARAGRSGWCAGSLTLPRRYESRLLHFVRSAHGARVLRLARTLDVRFAPVAVAECGTTRGGSVVSVHFITGKPGGGKGLFALKMIYDEL